jgi:hypothetical protein
VTIPSNLTRYKAHNSLSDPGKHRERIGELQDELGCLMKVVRGLLVHGDWLPVYGLNPGDFAQHSRATLPTASKLDAVLTISDAALYAGGPQTGELSEHAVTML